MKEEIIQELDEFLKNDWNFSYYVFHGGINTCADDNFESIREAQKRGIVIDAGMAAYIHTDFGIFEDAIKGLNTLERNFSSNTVREYSQR